MFYLYTCIFCSLWFIVHGITKNFDSSGLRSRIPNGPHREEAQRHSGSISEDSRGDSPDAGHGGVGGDDDEGIGGRPGRDRPLRDTGVCF